MLRVDRTGKRLTRLPQSTLAEAEHWERQIQDIIIANPDPFCEELGENLWLIGQEVHPSETISDRIDILAVDESGRAVIIELKRGTNKLQLLQAISYAGMISHWSTERFVETLAKNYHESNESLDDARAAIQAHIDDEELSDLNQSQRIILLAEDFDPALLFGAEWLYRKFRVDVRCYRMSLSKDDTGEYLSCVAVYPPADITSLRRGRMPAPDSRDEDWSSWDDALSGVDNRALVAFYRNELSRERDYFEPRLRYRELFYRIRGRRRFTVGCRQNHAYVWQDGRFAGDSEQWRQRLSDPAAVVEVNNRRALRFLLFTPSDFEAFSGAVNTDLRETNFN